MSSAPPLPAPRTPTGSSSASSQAPSTAPNKGRTCAEDDPVIKAGKRKIISVPGLHRARHEDYDVDDDDSVPKESIRLQKQIERYLVMDRLHVKNGTVDMEKKTCNVTDIFNYYYFKHIDCMSPQK